MSANVIYGTDGPKTTAHYQHAPNVVGVGLDKGEALKDLLSKPNVSGGAENVEEKIETTKLPHAVRMGGQLMTHSAWRANTPEVQGYGISAHLAKVNLLGKESAAPKGVTLEESAKAAAKDPAPQTKVVDPKAS